MEKFLTLNLQKKIPLFLAPKCLCVLFAPPILIVLKNPPFLPASFSYKYLKYVRYCCYMYYVRFFSSFSRHFFCFFSFREDWHGISLWLWKGSKLSDIVQMSIPKGWTSFFSIVGVKWVGLKSEPMFYVEKNSNFILHHHGFFFVLMDNWWYIRSSKCIRTTSCQSKSISHFLWFFFEIEDGLVLTT